MQEKWAIVFENALISEYTDFNKDSDKSVNCSNLESKSKWNLLADIPSSKVQSAAAIQL